jgi:surfactin synthase thioesterase subunit
MKSMSINSPWLVSAPGPQRPLRLYCFSHAGGSAADYRAWQALAGGQIEICAVELPGHGARRLEQPAASLAYVIAAVSLEIARQGHPAFSFFGHSLGALIAFEVTRHCMRHQLPLPQQLFVSGCTAPQRRRASRGLHCMSDDELIAELGAYNGTPPELLAHRELMEMVLPTLRADFALAENYAYAEGAPLTMPLTALAGREDEHVAADEVEAWALESGAGFQSAWFEGDHFYLNQQRQGVIDLIKATLR